MDQGMSSSAASRPDEDREVAQASASMGLQVAGDCPEDCRQWWVDPLMIAAAGVICLLPVIYLMVSAFTMDMDGQPGNDGLASEGSKSIRAFTMGWMFCLALKLRGEFIG